MTQTIAVESKEGFIFQCEVDVLRVSAVLRPSLENVVNSDSEPLRLDFNQEILQRILWYMRNHLEDQKLTDDSYMDETMNAWDKCFFNTNIDILLELNSAANFLNIRRLYVQSTNKLAEVINEKLSDPVDPVRAITEAFHMSEPKGNRNVAQIPDVSQCFVFEKLGSKDKRTAIDTLDVEVIHLPQRKLEEPKECKPDD